MGTCNLCKFSKEEKSKEINQTLITELDESLETKYN